MAIARGDRKGFKFDKKPKEKVLHMTKKEWKYLTKSSHVTDSMDRLFGNKDNYIQKKFTEY